MYCRHSLWYTYTYIYIYIHAYTTHIFVCACQYARACAYLHPSRAHTFQALKILRNHCRHRHRAIHCETQGASPFIINGRSIHWNQGWGGNGWCRCTLNWSIHSSPPWFSMPALLPTETCVALAAHSTSSSVHAGRVQAWPLPLTGAGLTQNLHQAAVDETVGKTSIRQVYYFRRHIYSSIYSPTYFYFIKINSTAFKITISDSTLHCITKLYMKQINTSDLGHSHLKGR